MYKSVVVGCGGYLPKNSITNDDLSKFVDTNHEWIFQRTGIEKRHFAAEGEMTSDLATQAAFHALQSSGLSANDLDLIVLATATPDETFPSTATIVQRKIGMQGGFAFDVAAVCAGFITALNVADNFIKTGQVKTAMVIGAETLSKILDMKDRSTCVLFGDGAGAIILQAEKETGDKNQRGVVGVSLNSDGNLHDLLYVSGGPSSNQTTGFIKMMGKEVYSHAVIKLAESAEETLAKFKIPKEEINWFIPHQANIRIIKGLAKRLDVSWEKVIHTVGQHANTSAASIPLAINEANQAGKLKKGDLLLHDAIGGGLIWGSAIVRW